MHKFVQAKCLQCGRETYLHQGLCGLCLSKKNQKQKSKISVYCCNLCGNMWNTSALSTASDILAESIAHHYQVEHNGDFVNRVLKYFTKEYKDYPEPALRQVNPN